MDNDLELRRKVIEATPVDIVVKFDLLRKKYSTPEKFRSAIQSICGDELLPTYFPAVPKFLEAKNKGILTNNEYRLSQLALPGILYDSATYEIHTDLRGPLEEIIYAYEAQKVRLGLPATHIIGDSWSEHFKKRMGRVYRPRVGLVERDLEDRLDKLEINQSGLLPKTGTRLG